MLGCHDLTEWSQEPLAPNFNLETTNSMYDNTSLRTCQDQPECECQQFLTQSLKYLQFALSRAIQNYFAKSFMLLALPFIFGLVAGYILCRNIQTAEGEGWLALFRNLGSYSKIFRVNIMVWNKGKEFEKSKEDIARKGLESDVGTSRECPVDKNLLPRHIAVVMDGNRRHGRKNYHNASAGHWDGCHKLLEFSKWCIAEEIPTLTVFAFSTENWNRSSEEVATLMRIFVRYCEELRKEAADRNIRVRVLSTDADRIPAQVQEGLQRMVEETCDCNGLQLNICLSYGARGEITQACKSLASDCVKGSLDPHDISQALLQQRLLTNDLPDPCLVIRTSGEFRISNFLLWQIAYSELFFLDKNWPDVEKADLLLVIENFAKGRQRRFGK